MIDDVKKEEQTFNDDFETQIQSVANASPAVKDLMRKLTQKIFEKRMKLDALVPQVQEIEAEYRKRLDVRDKTKEQIGQSQQGVR